MTTLVHVSPTVYAPLGLVVLRVDTSGDPAPDGLVTLARRLVGATTTSAVTVPAGYLDPSGDVQLINGSGLFYDTTAPLDTPFEYLAALPGQQLVVSATPVTLPSLSTWRLGDPFRPYLDMPLILARNPAPMCPLSDRAAIILGLSDDALDGQGEMERVPGSRYPMVATDPISSPSFEIRFATRTQADRVAAEELLAPGGVLLLRAPGSYELPPRFVVVTQARSARISSDHRRSWRAWTVQVREVDRPDGAAYGWLGTRWVDLCTGPYATWAAVEAAGLSWASLGSGAATGAVPAAMRTWTEVSATWATWATLTATGKTWAQVVAGD